jgi:hypothetical protein
MTARTGRIARCAAVGFAAGATTALLLVFVNVVGVAAIPLSVISGDMLTTPSAWLGATIGGMIGAGACAMTAAQRRHE